VKGVLRRQAIEYGGKEEDWRGEKLPKPIYSCFNPISLLIPTMRKSGLMMKLLTPFIWFFCSLSSSRSGWLCAEADKALNYN
jgi:hypothetical protein